VGIADGDTADVPAGTDSPADGAGVAMVPALGMGGLDVHAATNVAAIAQTTIGYPSRAAPFTAEVCHVQVLVLR
jgi:hypothetical protein